MLWYHFYHIKCSFLDFDWLLVAINTGRRLHLLTSPELKQFLPPRQELDHMLDRMTCLWHSQALASQDLLITSKFMCLEAYGLNIWSQSKRARYFNLATIVLTLTNLFCSHSSKLYKKFLMLQAIPAMGFHFMIQSPTKQLRSTFLWHCGHKNK